MSVTEDLINFDIIETHKENIQSLPEGRSAKALASSLAPTLLFSPVPTPGVTRNTNDAIRQEYELEVISISDSDDPLDIYDRYVKWTLNAYPSAQATSDSQLRPLLERATKAFQTASHYKNDPRYLKLWLTYIRLFSDAPRETFAYLARHNIGEGLALFYEEFAAWLEGAGRWTQAEEVYRIGIEREARPMERMLRKFGEFQNRSERQPQNGEDPSSPALPTVRPALVAKLDPFASSTPRPTDTQAQRQASGIGGAANPRAGGQKLTIFSDAEASRSTARSMLGETAKGWDDIGSIQDRKKENMIGARPWAGETLKGGKKIVGPPKLMIFKDEAVPKAPGSNNVDKPCFLDQQPVTNPKTGKIERVFVNLEAVYPNPNDPNEEFSFEELRAKHRGWLQRDWQVENVQETADQTNGEREEKLPDVIEEAEDEGAIEVVLTQSLEQRLVLDHGNQILSPSTKRKEGNRENRPGRSRKTKIMEVKGETQTIRANLESPTGPKMKRKNSAEPTMTLHTRAATDDILDIFNQPLRNVSSIGNHVDSGEESDYDEDDYTSAGESTGTGRISGASEFGDDETGIRSIGPQDDTNGRAATEWSDCRTDKQELHEDVANDGFSHGDERDGYIFVDPDQQDVERNIVKELVTPISPEADQGLLQTKFVPIPPEDYEPPIGPYRDPSILSQNRLPFMTPIVEKTESSIGLPTVRDEEDYFISKTPSRQGGDGTPVVPKVNDDLLSSPFQEIVNEANAVRQKNKHTSAIKKGSEKVECTVSLSSKRPNQPIIKDAQCNPVDDTIRQIIVENIQPPLSTYTGFHDYRPRSYNKGAEIRKFVKALAKASKNASEKTLTNLSLPPFIRFANGDHRSYTIKRELGKGAYAPVYLAESGLVEDDEVEQDKETGWSSSSGQTRPMLSAIKCEDPPTPWEFYIMSIAHQRLDNSRATKSIAKAYELHLFSDEGYLIEEYCDQGTLLDLVNVAKADATTGGSGVLDEAVVMFFTIELLRTVEALHSKGILHGDLKADNCLVRLPPTSSNDVDSWSPVFSPSGSSGWSSKGLTLIDFGRGIDLTHFAPSAQFIADWKTTKQDCPEMREMRPWSWQIDYWGVAGVVHVLLFGRWIEDVVDVKNGGGSSAASEGCGGEASDETVALGKMKRYKLKEPLKRYWQTELWARLFDVLMNPVTNVAGEEDGKMPVLNAIRECREGMEGWLVVNGEKKGLKTSLRRLEERVARPRKG